MSALSSGFVVGGAPAVVVGDVAAVAVDVGCTEVVAGGVEVVAVVAGVVSMVAVDGFVGGASPSRQPPAISASALIAIVSPAAGGRRLTSRRSSLPGAGRSAGSR